MTPTPAPGVKKPEDVFHCPVCGQKHRGDLSAIRAGGPALKATCAGCRRPLLIEWKDAAAAVRIAGADGLGVGPGAAAPLDPDRTRETPLAAGDAAPETAAPPSRPPPKLAAARRADRGGKSSGGERRPESRSATARPEGAAAKKPRRSEAKPEEPEARPEPDVPAEFASGTKVGRYTLEDAIGAGGTGTVYRAFDPTTNRYVALKFLAQGLSDAMRTRFLREIEVQANLRHPHLMPVFDRGEHEGRPYFTMELLYRPFTLTQIVSMAREGTLSRYATLRPFEEVETLIHDVFIPVCEAINVANVENGVVHRDLKPDNILVDSRTLRPYVIDFGICHVLERKTRVSTTVLAPTGEDAGIVGTPRFLAPEQARGTAHERTDVWGLGAVLHFCLTGEPPIAAAAPISRAELRRRVDALRETETAALAAGDERKAELCSEKLSRLEDVGLRTMDDLFRDAREGVYIPLPAGVPAEVAAVVAKAMAPRTADRYVNARSMAADLSAWLEGAQTRAMAERGASAASVVQGAQRAIREHLVTAVLVVVALAVGVFLAPALGLSGGGSILGGGGGRLDDVRESLTAIEHRAEAYGDRASRLSSGEAARAYDALRDELAAARKRIDGAGAGGAADAAKSALREVGDRFAAPRVEFRAPPGTPVRLTDLARGGGGIDAKAGEVVVPPGEYAVTIGGSGRIRLPLRVPFVLRAPGHAADRDPAIVVVAISVAPDSIPAGMQLVVPPSAGVEHRGPPFAAVPPMPVQVAPFLMDRAETTNRDYLSFLESLSDEQRDGRLPATGFKPDLQRARHVKVSDGLEECPVAGVSPSDAASYCAWKGRRDNAKIRLPTEAEWAAAAGVALGWLIPCGWDEKPSEADFAPPLKPVTEVPERPEPYGILGLLGNVREIVTAVRTGGSTVEFLSKGGAAGDDPSESAIRRVRPVGKDLKDPKNGIRCVRETSAP